MDRYQTIIIGAGVGGLTAAAYLVKSGVKTLIVEKTPFPGGRCYARKINDGTYDIGALYIGDRVPEILEAVFDIGCAYKPYRMGIKTGDGLVSVPFGYRTLRELNVAGVPIRDILGFLWRVPNLFRSSFYDRYPSVGSALDALTDNNTIRQLGQILFGVMGTSPYRLPSYYLDGNAGTNTGNPVHIRGGNRQIADQLVTFIRDHGGQLAFQENVKRITFKGARAAGVLTDKSEYAADYVISNADIRTTVLELGQSGPWSSTYLQKIQSLERPLALACVFLAFKATFELPDGFGVFFMPGPSPIEEYDNLRAGRLPEESTFCLQVPTNLEHTRTRYHQATLQFYYPRKPVTQDILEQHVQNIMVQGLEQLFPGFSDQIINYDVYDPARYRREFGLNPFVFGVSPTLGRERHSPQTHVSNLFCVGDSVLPEKPSVPQAMESGLMGAQAVLKHMTGGNHPTSPQARKEAS